MSDDCSVNATALRESGQGNVTSQNPFGLLLVRIWGAVHIEKLHDLYFSPVVSG
jgi:hypothetical protein